MMRAAVPVRVMAAHLLMDGVQHVGFAVQDADFRFLKADMLRASVSGRRGGAFLSMACLTGRESRPTSWSTPHLRR